MSKKGREIVEDVGQVINHGAFTRGVYYEVTDDKKVRLSSVYLDDCKFFARRAWDLRGEVLSIHEVKTSAEVMGG